MALDTAKTIREEAACPICLELMTEPVFIDCGHIYCHSCIMKNLENQQHQSLLQGNFQCPVCRAQFQRESIRPSKQLESIIATIKKMEQENLCEEHGEKLSLFCEDDSQLICLLCERKAKHKGHTTVLAADACEDYKETFQEVLTYLRNQEVKNKECKGNTCEKIKEVQTQSLQKKIRGKFVFKLLHLIQYMEEESYQQRLEIVEDQYLKRLKDSEAQLEKQSQELNKHILELERKCQGSAQEILQDVTDTLNRISPMKLNAPEDVSLDFHAVPDVDRILRQFLKMFKIHQVKITLDPDTAHNNLLVKNDEKVTGGSPKVKHETPARFKELPCVLGCETITSGKQYFKIHNIRGPEWDIGVCRESVPRDNDVRRDPESGFWAIRHSKGDGYVALTSPLTPLCLKNVNSIRVFVDYEAGLVSFYNFDTVSHIFTFPKATFSEPIRPYFRVGKNSALHI